MLAFREASMSHSKALAVLTLAFGVALSGLLVARQVIAIVAEAEADRLHRSILAYVAEKNPQAPIRAFTNFPALLVAEAHRSRLDHCLVLAQAEVESGFRHDAVGSAGEIGVFQVLPSTAAMLEPKVGPFRRPVVGKAPRDLGDLADPLTNTRFALAYLRDILSRKPNLREALTEYNGGPAGRQSHYYRMVMGTYVEVLEREELRCRFQQIPKNGPPLLALRA
jgi:soluble lytic murein transglycosylase-like protein